LKAKNAADAYNGISKIKTEIIKLVSPITVIPISNKLSLVIVLAKVKSRRILNFTWQMWKLNGNIVLLQELKDGFL